MQQQADDFTATRTNRTEPLSLGMGRIVKCGSVLQAQRDGLFPHARQRGLMMGRPNGVRLDRLIFKEAISALAPRARPAGLWDGGGGLLGEGGSDHLQTAEQSLIGQLGTSEFLERPIIGLSGRRTISGCIKLKHPAIEYISCCGTSTKYL